MRGRAQSGGGPMARTRAEASRDAGSGGLDLAGQAEQLASRLRGGVSRLAAQAQRGARKMKDAAHDLRGSPVLQQALAARERGNLEAAFWLLNEEFTHRPAPDVALHYWDVALSLGRVDLATDAGVALVESHAAAGEPELAAQHWLELVKDAPDVLVSPAAIVTILPVLKQRLAEARDDGPEDRETLAGLLRRAVRHAVDPRNTGLHPGVALRLFEQGRDVNPEAARRAAEAALESPHLHETKRARLSDWLAGKPLEPLEARPAPSPRPKLEPGEPVASAGLSRDEIQAAARRLPRPSPGPQTGPTGKPATKTGPEPATVAPAARAWPETPTPAARAETAAEAPERVDRTPRVAAATLESLDDEGIVLGGPGARRLAWDDIEAVAAAEVMGLEDHPVALVDLIPNWTRRQQEPLEILRLRVVELDLGRLVTRKHALGSDFAALMGDIMERSSAIPLPDPESALGTRITCFESPALYLRVGLRVRDDSIA